MRAHQPKTEEVAPAVRFRPVLIIGPAVNSCAIVEELHIPGSEFHVQEHALTVGHLLKERKRLSGERAETAAIMLGAALDQFRSETLRPEGRGILG